MKISVPRDTYRRFRFTRTRSQIGAPGDGPSRRDFLKATGGGFERERATVRVDPGTTLVWEWSGEGGSHNVAAEDGSFESEMTGDADHTFEQTFEVSGVTKYACVSHEPTGMKGAVVVGDAGAGGAESKVGVNLSPETAAVGRNVLLGLLSPLVFGAFLFGRRSGKSDAAAERPGVHVPGWR